MRLFTLHLPSFLVYFSVLLFGTLLLPKPSFSDPAKSSREPTSTFSPDSSSTAESLPEPKVEIRAPVETPPTEYLPYRESFSIQRTSDQMIIANVMRACEAKLANYV